MTQKVNTKRTVSHEHVWCEINQWTNHGCVNAESWEGLLFTMLSFKKKMKRLSFPWNHALFLTTLTLTLLWKRYSLINSFIETTIPTTNFMESWNSSNSDALHTQVKYLLGSSFLRLPFQCMWAPGSITPIVDLMGLSLITKIFNPSAGQDLTLLQGKIFEVILYQWEQSHPK